jgi:hypothetical protein
MCYHPTMRPYVVAVLLLTIAGPVVAADPLAEARRLYNLDNELPRSWRARLPLSRRADAARVAGPIQLE